MKNLNLDSIGVHEMNTLEMQSADGGVVLIILAVCAIALTLPFCTKVYNPDLHLESYSNSSSSGNSVSVDTIDLAKRYNMPIGY